MFATSSEDVRTSGGHHDLGQSHQAGARGTGGSRLFGREPSGRRRRTAGHVQERCRHGTAHRHGDRRQGAAHHRPGRRRLHRARGRRGTAVVVLRERQRASGRRPGHRRQQQHGRRSAARAAAACGLVRTLRASDRGAVMEVRDAVRIPQPLTSDRGQIESTIRGMRASGNTALYDGLYVVLKELDARAS